MIYDCFQFFNELDLLNLRLNTLYPFVDFFVLSEATVTFSGEQKPLFFNENKHLFDRFSDKIIHVIVNDTPDVNPFERDVFQKNAVSRGLTNCIDSDVIIFSDLDEIPSTKVLSEILKNFDKEKVYHLAQRQFYFFVNLEEISGNLLSYSGEFEGVTEKKWLGTKVCSYSKLKNCEIGNLRSPDFKKNGVRVENGGWHFTYMGGDRNTDIVSRIEHKIKSAAHQEFNNKNILSNIKKNVQKKNDIFGRNAMFKIVEIDDSFPEYLLQNREEFDYLILKEKNKKLFGLF